MVLLLLLAEEVVYRRDLRPRSGSGPAAATALAVSTGQ